jgi:hypothetical protein
MSESVWTRLREAAEYFSDRGEGAVMVEAADRGEDLEQAVLTAFELKNRAERRIGDLERALLRIAGIGLGPDHGSAQWQVDTAIAIAREVLGKN